MPTDTNHHNKELQLVASLTVAKAPGPFSVTLVTDRSAILLNARKLASRALEPQVLEQLLRDQRVNVSWESRAVDYPINVDLDARLLLPLSPGAESPSENVLLAYYQGKIKAEDIYPPPPDDPDVAPVTSHSEDANDSMVDTARIQSYQIREFVEALQGILDDLHSAAQGTEIAMKYAILGHVSPLALARQVIQAVREHRRSSTAAGFQLTEILSCLAKAEGVVVPAIRRDAWLQCIALARKEITALLSNLLERNGGELKSQPSFRRYLNSILRQPIDS
jgi:hypothetical protein